jgi:hypothetical protein
MKAALALITTSTLTFLLGPPALGFEPGHADVRNLKFTHLTTSARACTTQPRGR